jgi:adenosylcobinamide-phosphate synthase
MQVDRYDPAMSFFAILFALLIEQVRPLGPHNPIHSALRVWARWVSRNFDAGKPAHGWVAWILAVLVPAAAATGIHWLLVAFVGWPAGMVWSVVVLYVTLGFRQFSHHFTAIRDALEAGDEVRARQLLAQWQRVDASELPRSEIVRHVIEFSVLAAHRHVFGVLAWFSVLAAFGLGPAGAVLYRMAEFVARYWRHRSRMQVQPASEALQSAAAGAWTAVDWLPARFTAVGFAVVGSFEEAIDCWRNYAQRFPNDNDGVILAATSGAVNVRLGGETLKPVFAPGDSGAFQAAAVGAEAPAGTASTPGREAEVAHLRSIVGLVWRSVVLWMVLLALLTLARLLG